MLKVVHTSKMNIKELIIIVLVVASGVLNAYLWQGLIFGGISGGLWSLLVPAAGLFVFATFFSLLAVFNQGGPIGFIAVAASFIGSFFFVKASPTVLVGLLLALGISFWAFRTVQTEVSGSAMFRLSKILRRGMPLFFTAVAILISVFYFASLTETASSYIVPRAVFDLSLPYTEEALQALLPGFKSTLSGDELIFGIVESQLKKEGVDISKVSRGELSTLLKAQRSALEQALGASIPGEANAADLIYELLNTRAEALLGEYKIYMPYISAVGFFLTIKVLSSPLYLIALGFIWLVMQFLLAIGALRRETVSIEVERITL